jgi:hypothetical protein
LKTIRGNSNRFSTEILRARKAWSEAFPALKNFFNSRIIFPTKLSFQIEGGINTFHEKLELKQYMTTKPALQKILKGILLKEDEYKHNCEHMGIIKSQEKIRQVIRE